MNRLSHTSTKRLWFKATAVIFALHLQLSSAGDACPSQAKLDPCICFHNAALTGTSPTNPTPVEAEQKEGRIPRAADPPTTQQPTGSALLTALNNQSRLLPNDTCCTIVSCNAPKSLEILENAITNALSRKWVDKMILSNLPPEKGYTLVRLPGKWLKTLRIKHFEVRDTVLSGDFIHYGSPFEGQEQSMLWFTARNCYLSGSLSYDVLGTVNSKGLNYMPKIEGVDLSRNHLVLITAMGFRYPPTNLSTIILSHNSIQSIETAAFYYVPLLKRVDLSHNVLEIIARNMFAAPARTLEHINLSWNLLKSIPTDFFVNMPQLKVVILSNNFLTSIPNQPWAAVWRQLTFVDLTNNFLLCDCSLLWLLPLLSPPVSNVSTTPAPLPLPGQTALGTCSFVQSNFISKVYQLTTVTRGSLMC